MYEKLTPEQQPGINVSHLEPVFENITPLRQDINIIRAAVWEIDDKRSARMLRITPGELHFDNSHLDHVEELKWPVTYRAYLATPRHSGLIIFETTWLTDWDGTKAHRMERGDMFHYFDESEIAQLRTAEDIFEAYDTWHIDYANLTAGIGGKDRISPNIYSPDGLEDLASSFRTSV